jgi:hypothetical protein
MGSSQAGFRHTASVPRMMRLFIAGMLAALSMSALAGTPVSAQNVSLAGDHSEVIAQGIDTLPGSSMAWRVVQDTAEPRGEAGFEERALGFVIATDGEILLTDEATGARAVLAPGEAAFTSEGMLQSREGTGETSTSYLRVGLVDAAEAGNGNGDQVLYAGNGFAAPSGEHEIELIGVKLGANESTQLSTTSNSLVYVTEGSVTAGSETLSAGSATTIAGPIQLQAAQEGARVYVATIGSQVEGGSLSGGGPVATTVPEGDASSSRIVVLSALCPVGVTAEEAQSTENGDPCFGGEAVTDMTVQVINTETGEATEMPIDPTNASVAFQGLAAGNYNVIFATGEGLGETVGTCGGQDQSADLPAVSVTGSSVNLDLPADREYLCVTRTVQLDDSLPTGGLLSATFFTCPAGMTAETIDPTQCTLITEGFDFGFQVDAGTELHLADALLADGTFVWGDLPIAPDANSGPSYSPIAYAYPDGYGAFGISTDGGPVLAQHAGGFGITQDHQSFVLAVYFFTI